MARIAILTGNHLCNNPRVMKEASALAASGHRVTVLGAWYNAALKARDIALMETAAYDFRAVLDGSVSGNVGQRIRSKLGSISHRALGYENVWQLGYAYPHLRHAAFAENADLYIAHSEQALAVGVELLRNRRRVGVDMEDWFSQDLPEKARRGRPITLLAQFERSLLQNGAPCFCTSHAMSKGLAATYNCPEPVVIYNAFPWHERKTLDAKAKDRTSNSRPSIHWYSQTLGEGRGLEILLQALAHVPHDAEIHLRGTPASGFDDWLHMNTPAEWRARIFIHPVVHNHELLSRIAEHDIGFAGELPYCGNKDLTVSNKLFHCLLAGLAIVASDTAGQREIAQAAPGAVALYKPDDARALARELCAFLQSPEKLAAAKSAALAAAKDKLCWEKQEKILLAAVSKALQGLQPDDAFAARNLRTTKEGAN